MRDLFDYLFIELWGNINNDESLCELVARCY